MLLPGRGKPVSAGSYFCRGKIDVYKGELKIAEYKDRGMVLGELSGILNKPRTASLVALEPTVVLSITSGLDQLIAELPDVTRKILINLAERLAKTADDLLTAVHKDIQGRNDASNVAR
jgi:CRP-like cAMP-binding protein